MATERVFMSIRQYTAEFGHEAVKQVIERGFTVLEVAARIGVPKHTLYAWAQAARKLTRTTGEGTAVTPSDSAEVRRLKAELKRATEERGLQKKGRRVLCQGMKAKYAFMRAHHRELQLKTMCPVLGVHRSGYYA